MEPAVRPAKISVQPSDEMLLDRARQRNPDAFEQIFFRYGETVYEYSFLLTGDAKRAENLFLKTFVRFYRRITGAGLNQKPLAQLLKNCHRLISRDYPHGTSLNPIPSPHYPSYLSKLNLEDRALFVLGKRYALSVGAIGWILGKSSVNVVERLNLLPSPEEFSAMPPAVPAIGDYLAVLRSKIQRIETERKSYGAIFVAAAVLFVGFFIYMRVSPRHAGSKKPLTISSVQLPLAPAPVTASGVLEAPKENRIARLLSASGELPLQKIQMSREAFFTRDESFAEDQAVIMPGRGKVLALDFELFKKVAAAGLKFSFREPVDLKDFSTLNFWVRGDEEAGVPAGFFIVFSRAGTPVLKKLVTSISPEWRLVRIPLNHSESAEINEVSILFEGRALGNQTSGRLYLDQISFMAPAKK